ncbi:MAG: sialidase family protein [Chloroflexota bacterium]
MIRVIDSGPVFVNPDPDLRALHAWHPTLARLGGGRWLCSFDLGSAVLAQDYATWLAASDDDGRTWSEPWRMAPFEAVDGPDTHSLRITRLRDGSFVAAGARWHRSGRYARGLNRETSGWCPMDLVLSRSADGRTWSPFEVVPPPLVGPAFEVCHRIVELADGTWLWPTSTWPGWDGDTGDGLRAVALVSTDQGRTWPGWVEVLDARADGLAHWEQSIVPLADGRLLAVGWAFDPARSVTHALPYTFSRVGAGPAGSGGAPAFVRAGSTGLLAQTTKLAALPDGRVLAVYRRDDQPGLWATVAAIEGDVWRSLAEVPLWAGAPSGMRGQGRTVAEDLSDLGFGAPNPVVAEDGSVLVAFWCRESCVYGIRWMRLAIEG